MSGSPGISRIITPVRLDYSVCAGPVRARFLRAIMEGRLIGDRCPETGKVYVPPRGYSPTHGVPCVDEIDIPDVGTLTTFCVINIPFEGQRLAPPYVAGAIVLDGADVPLFHIVAGVDPAEVRMGLRVKAVWQPPADRGPTLESIRFFEPTGEPDAAFDTYREHL